MKIKVTDPDLGTLEWELPPLIADPISAAKPESQQLALEWLQNQIHGFAVAVMGSIDHDRKRANLEQTVVELVAEVLVD